MKIQIYIFHIIQCLFFGFVACTARANITLPLDDSLKNFAGLAAGSTSQWHGSKERIVGVVPGARVELSQGRFLEWYGPYLGVNLIRNSSWEAGPVLNFRFGRQDVDDPVVATLPEIATGLEAGAYIGWHYWNTEGFIYRLRWGIMAITKIAGQTAGTNINPYVSFWVPLTPKVFIGFGGGLSWADDNFMDLFFSVTESGATASGLPVYDATSDLRQYYLWPALLWRMADSWMLGSGVFYQQLQNSASDSPIIKERGTPQQWTYGLGLGYVW